MEPATFVNRVARAAFGLSAAGAAMAVAQNAILYSTLAEVGAAAGDGGAAPVGGAGAIDLRVVFAAWLGLCLVSLGVSAALLRRRRWARTAFVGVLAMFLAASLGKIAFGWSTPAPEATDPAGYVAILRLVAVVDVAGPAVVAILCVWLIARFASPAVRAEFGG
jgi:hypothetical protein